MKKLFIIILSIALMIGMVMHVSADTVYTNCEHYGQTLTASETGYLNIVFSDGYRGFCIKKGLDGADAGDTFTIDNMGLAVNNKSQASISDYLKVMFVDYFNDIFTVNTTNMTYEFKDERKIQRIAWYFRTIIITTMKI